MERVPLRPNETRTVRLQLKGTDLAYWDAAGHSFVLEPGSVGIIVGTSSAGTRIEKTISVTP
jgi:beta-glucosidase